MSIENPSKYVFVYSVPGLPSISVNVQTAPVSAVETASSAYMTSAAAYANAYVEMINNRDYLKDMLMKDLCASVDGMTSGGLNLADNSVFLHQKANELFQAAGSSVATTSNAVINVVSSFDAFYSAYYMDDAHEHFILDTSSDYYTAALYDERAITVPAATMSAITGDSSSMVFINDMPNAVGNKKEYTCYTTTTESDAYVNTPAYTVAYNSAYEISSGVTSGVWEMKVAGDSAAIAYTTDAFDGSANWTVVGA